MTLGASLQVNSKLVPYWYNAVPAVNIIFTVCSIAGRPDWKQLCSVWSLKAERQLLFLVNSVFTSGYMNRIEVHFCMCEKCVKVMWLPVALGEKQVWRAKQNKTKHTHTHVWKYELTRWLPELNSASIADHSHCIVGNVGLRLQKWKIQTRDYNFSKCPSLIWEYCEI